MGIALLIVIWLITFASSYFFLAKTWWLPTGASAAAAGIDHHFATTYLLMGIVFVAAQLSLGFFAWRFRERGSSPPARYVHGNNLLEIVWTVLTAILFIGLNLMSSSIWASERFRPAQPGATQVEVTGMQFQWYFRYPGPDGKFGRTDLKLVNDSGGNPFGIDDKDPASKDDIVSASLKIPAGKPIKLIMHSRDVIHNFFVRELRMKQDIVPGMEIPMSFQADTIGTYEVPCSELCGLGHFQMRTTMQVMSPADFEKWKIEKAQK